MRDAHLLIVDVSGGQRGEYEWFVKDAEDGKCVANGSHSCDGISWEEALTEAEEVGYQVIYAMVLDGPKDFGLVVSPNRLVVTEEYDLDAGETRYFSPRNVSVVQP